MKLKLLSLGVCIFSLLLTACAPGGYDRQAVVDKFKTTEVSAIPGSNSEFIARSADGSVWYVTTSASSTVSSTTQLFGEYVPSPTK